MRKIAVLNGSRADANPLSGIMAELDSHCVPINTQGIYGNEQHVINQLLDINPDILLCLGDRIETLLAATIAASMTIPIAHIHGGEETEGAVDNVLRHAITKLAYWHFPSHELYASRIRQMGENPDNIFVFGAPGIDCLAHQIMTREACEKELGVKLEHPIALVCYHPETLSGKDQENLLEIANHFGAYRTVIVSGANADAGGKEINEWWGNNANIYSESYPHLLWISLMHYADVLIGNSSGFIIEGMTLQGSPNGRPIIKIIGERQKGRYEDAKNMFAKNPYAFGKPGNISKQIAEKLLSVAIPEKPRKVFYGH